MPVKPAKKFFTKIGVVMALALIGSSLTPTVAQAVTTPVNTVANAAYEQPFSWGTPVSLGTSTANRLTFVSTFSNADLTGQAGKDLSFATDVTAAAPLTPANFKSSATLTFFDTNATQIGDPIELDSLDATGSAALTSVAIPSDAASLSAIVSTEYEHLLPTDPSIPQDSFGVDYAVKIDGVQQSVQQITGSTPAATGFYVLQDTNQLKVARISGAYTVPGNATASHISLFTCVNYVDLMATTRMIPSVKMGATNYMSVVKAGTQPRVAFSEFRPDSSRRVVTKSTWGSALIYKASGDAYGSWSWPNQEQMLVEVQVDENYPVSESVGSNGVRGPYQLAVNNAANQEKSAPCVTPEFTSTANVSLAQDNVNLQVSQPGDLNGDEDIWKVAFYRESNLSTPVYVSEEVPYSSSSLLLNLNRHLLPLGGERLIARLIRVYRLSQLQLDDDPVDSIESSDSSAFVVPDDVYHFTSQFSNGNDAGQINLKTDVGSEMNGFNTADGQQSTFSDGESGLFEIHSGYSPDGRSYPIFLNHLTNEGLDQNLAGTGNASVSIYNGRDAFWTTGAWMGARDKWAVAAPHGNPALDFASANTYLKVVSGSLGSSQVNSVDFTGSQMNAFCDANESGSKFWDPRVTSVMASPMADPIMLLGCNKIDPDTNRTIFYNFLVKVTTSSQSPSISVLYRFNKGSDTNASISTYNQTFQSYGEGRYTAYPYATASSDRAIAFYAFSGAATASPWDFRASNFNLVRMNMDGTYTETPNPTGVPALDVPATSWNAAPTLPPMSAGSAIHGFLDGKHYVARSAGFDSGTDMTTAAAAPFSSGIYLEFAPNSVIGGAETANFIRSESGSGISYTTNVDGDLQPVRPLFYTAPFSLNLRTNVGTTGEVLQSLNPSYGSSLWHTYYDNAGSLNLLVGTVSGKYSWIKWNPLVANYNNLSNVEPEIPGVSLTSQDTLYVLTQVGGKITFYGSGLNLASTATIDGAATTITSKKPTSLTISLPKNTAALPNLVTAGEKQIAIRFGNLGTLNRRVIYLAGTVKQNQTISAPTSLPNAHTAWTGTNIALSIPTQTSVDLAVSIKLSPAATCAMVNNVPTIVGAGTCVISLTQPGDLGTNKAAAVTRSVIIDKGVLNANAGSAFTLSDNPADDGTVNGDNNTRQLTPTSDFSGTVYSYSSDNSDVCAVDDNGLVTGVAIGSCTISVTAVGGASWITEVKTISVTVAASTSGVAVPDFLAEVTDGNLPAVAVPSNPNKFLTTNDASLEVKWDKVKGLLSVRSRGIYTGYILTETTFTDSVHNVTYTCTNVFGTVKAMPKKTAAQKKLAMKGKIFTAASAACKDAYALKIPGLNGVAGSLRTDFSKIAKQAKVKGTATTVGTKLYEAAAQTALKGFTGTVTIKTTRFRAWPTTMKNISGHTSAGNRIPATTRTTVITLQ